MPARRAFAAVRTQHDYSGGYPTSWYRNNPVYAP